MSRSAKAVTALALGSCLVTFAALRQADAVEGDCSRNVAACDFQTTRTLLRRQIWEGSDCKPARWSTLPRVGFPFDGTGKLQSGPRAPVHFLNGVCEAQSTRGDLERGIAELQTAQNAELLPAQRNVASLFEGLLHCRKLRQIPKDRLASSLSTRTAFCTARSLAKASFHRVAWTNLELAYEDGAPQSLVSHIDEMSQCYGELLHGGYDATCGIVSAPSPAQVAEAAEAVADEVLSNYFGDAASGTPGEHAVPPLKAMLARKIEMADASMRGSETLFAELTQKGQLLTASYRGLGEAYCDTSNADAPCAGEIPRKVARLHESYEQAVLAAQDVLSFVTQWVDGQYTHGGVDVRDGLRKRSSDVGLVLAALKEPSRPNELSLVDKLDRVKRDMRVLAGASADARTTVRRVCSVYFCELRRRSPMAFTSTCNQYDPVLGAKVSDGNKLCDPDVQKTFVTSDGRTTAYGICDEAQFPRALMTGGDVDACLAQYHP